MTGQGSAASEQLFRMLMSGHEARPTEPLTALLRQVVGELATWCRSFYPSARIGLNVIITDGHRLAGMRFGRGLYYVERDGIVACESCGVPHVHHDPKQAYQAVDIASEPITHEPWHEMPDGSVYQVSDDFRLQIEAL